MANDMDRILKDLSDSGLTLKDIQGRELAALERQATGIAGHITGYVIPYFDMYGKNLQHYRTKLLDGEIKYKQVKKTKNHVYFPPGFMKALKNPVHRTILLTEGEKKAALAVKLGFPAFALGGVDSWKNRIFTFPVETEMEKTASNSPVIRATIPSGTECKELDETDPGTAVGLGDILNYAKMHNLTVMFVYDTDSEEKSVFNVQRSAARLAMYMRSFGLKMQKVKQLKLPLFPGEPKTGLDDYLVALGDNAVEELSDLIEETLKDSGAFPRHPELYQHINKKLNQGNLERSEYTALSIAILSDLDAAGMRMNSKKEGQAYYFHKKQSALMKVQLNINTPGIQNAPFSRFIYNHYGISMQMDARLTGWMSTQFASEDPVIDVNPHRILALPKAYEDIIRFQISDGEYLEVSANGTKILPNGTHNILFEADRTEPLDVTKFKKAYDELKHVPIKNWWHDTLMTTRMADKGHHLMQTALLCYVSPFLYRWRGTQLPVEIWIGESGSGKSSTLELRLETQTGRPDLKNRPSDMKDWHAALANSGGLHVTDNVQLHNKSLRDMLSDEICRLITEPVPHVEMRKLYSDAEQISIAVNNVFVFTAIQQPFMANDLLQRALVIKFDKGDSSVSYNSNWKNQMLHGRGGREYWLAHQCLVLEKFFKVVKEKWDYNYKAQHRLINYEQILMLLGQEVFGIDMSWLPGKLSQDVQTSVASNDYALEGITVFAREVAPSKYMKNGEISFTAADIVAWATQNQDFADCALLQNARKLGNYMTNARNMLAQITGIKESGKKSANRIAYTIDKKQDQ